MNNICNTNYSEKKPVGRPRGDKQTEVIRVDILRWSFLKKIEKLSPSDYQKVKEFVDSLG
jgi:hypothetical protein